MNLKDAAWWIWSATLLCIGFGLFVDKAGFLFAVVLTIMNLHYYAYLDKSFTSFSVQVRAAILILFLAGLTPGLSWLYWIPFIGITVRNLTGYCLLARLLSLLPWNRNEPLTMALVKRRIFSPPSKGSVLAL
jgi:hypothetical protein